MQTTSKHHSGAAEVPNQERKNMEEGCSLTAYNINPKKEKFRKELLTKYRGGRELAVDLRMRDRNSGTRHSELGTKKYELNSPGDVRFCNNESLPSPNVLTMFTQQWVGIRQACSALSGPKLGIDGHHSFEAVEIGEIADELINLKTDQVVYHGMASSTSIVLSGLKKLLPNVRFYGVWHGTMAGWSSSEEIGLFHQFLQLADDGIYDRIAFLRQGMQRLHSRSYDKILYNIPPNVNVFRVQEPFDVTPIKCIFSSWNNTWKNMYTNILAANYSPCVGEIFSYYKPEIELFEKIRLVPFNGHEAHYQRLATMDLCLNVSINDCQPMTELEGLSVGTPSLRNDWNLDLETENRYEEVFTVKSYLNAEAIIEKISKIALLDPVFISDITKQHRSDLVNMSKIRYFEFLS